MGGLWLVLERTRKHTDNARLGNAMRYTLNYKNARGETETREIDGYKVLDGGLVEVRWDAKPARKIPSPHGLDKVNMIDLPAQEASQMLIGPAGLVSIEENE